MVSSTAIHPPSRPPTMVLPPGWRRGAPGDIEAGSLLEDAEDAAAEKGSHSCGGDDDPTLLVGEEVS